MKMAPEEIKPLFTFPEIDHTGLVRVQLQTELTEQGLRPAVSLFGLTTRPAQHHEVIRVTNEFTSAVIGPGPIERMQENVGQQRRNYASNAMGNFCFDVTLSYRRLERPRRVTDGM